MLDDARGWRLAEMRKRRGSLSVDDFASVSIRTGHPGVITRELALDTHDARMFALSAIRSAAPDRIRRYSKYIKKLALLRPALTWRR